MPRRATFKDIAEQRASHSPEALPVGYRPWESEDCFPTGVSVLNLILSGRVDGGWVRGYIGNIIGDSDTGKTLLGMTTLAEASLQKRFQHHQLGLDDVESANSFDVPRMFGPELARRLVLNDDPTVEAYYDRVYALTQGRQPFIDILDSMDSLDTEKDVELFEANSEARAKGTKLKDGYGMAKAKRNSDSLRKIKGGIRDKNSLVLIISQTRENIDPFSFAERTRAGGTALKFYSCYEMWLAVKRYLETTVNGVKHRNGVLVKVKVSKNHATGSYGTFQMPMYYGYGIDDVRTNILWLADIGWWSMGKDNVIKTRGEWRNGKVNEVALAVTATPEGSKQLRDVVQTAWDDLQSKLMLPGRYGLQAAAAPVQEDVFAE